MQMPIRSNSSHIKSLPSRKLLSEASPIIDFCFHLTFTIEYQYYYMRCYHLGCTFHALRSFAITCSRISGVVS